MPAFLQAPIRLTDNVVGVPSSEFGTEHLSDYLVDYARGLGVSEAPAPPRPEKRQWPTGPLPVTALVLTFKTEFPPDRAALLEATEPQFRNARRILSVITGDAALPFVTLVLPRESVAGWVTAPSSRGTVRIGEGNTGSRYRSQVTTIARAAERDDRFAFALGLLQDAVRETDFHARIARLFNCLECLLPLNPRREALTKAQRTRAEVKHMLGYKEGALSKYQSRGVVFEYDAVELGGRIRKHLYHGTPIRPGDLKISVGNGDLLVSKYPHLIANDLLRDCERQIARTARRVIRAKAS